VWKRAPASLSRPGGPRPESGDRAGAGTVHHPAQRGIFANGRWIAYQSSDGLDSKVFVQPFPPTGALHQVLSGARHPRWSNDGTELFVGRGPQIHALHVNSQPTLTFGPPTLLVRDIPLGGSQRNYDVVGDGKQFIGVAVAAGCTPSTAAAIRQIDVVLNWFEELKARTPTR
jgi:hypothetical protein